MTRINFLIFVFLVSCSNHVFRVDPLYRNKSIKSDNMAVVFLKNALQLDNEDDITDDLGEGDPQEVYMNLFKDVFTKALTENVAKRKARFSNVAYYPTLYDLKMKAISFMSPTGISYYYFPADIEAVSKISEDYVLFFKKLSSYRKQANPGIYNASTNSWIGGSSSALGMKVEYTLWDNKAAKLIQYGRFSLEDSFMFKMDDAEWKSTIYEIADTIFDDSPFK